MSRERALLRRLDKAEADLRAGGGYENELQYIPAGGVRSLLADLRALLAEPEGENDLTIRVPDAFSRLPLEQWVEFTAKLYRNADGTLLMDGESVTSTPRSRAEAEAMVEAYHSARDRMQIAAIECNVAEYHQGAFDMAKARAALLAALCGEGT